MSKANHKPNKTQNELIQIIKRYHKKTYITNRITYTMLNKSIVDARIPFRDFLRDEKILNFEPIKSHRDHVTRTVTIMNESGISRSKINFYAAETRGDTRFSIDNMSGSFNEDDLVYITTRNQELVFIKLDEYKSFESNLDSFFGK